MNLLLNTDRKLQGFSILVVEDDELSQQIARELLEYVGASVAVASHGKEALELLREKSFDCILMDLQMPVMNGFETTREIRTHSCWQAIPIIALTANVDQHYRDSCRQASMNDFLEKPINANKLTSTLQRWLPLADTGNSEKKWVRVLVLDDDPFMLEVISHLLGELGVDEVLVAKDGKEGLYVLSAQVSSIDLLICDIEMPGMDGVEFLRTIADQEYQGKIAVFSGIEPALLKSVERLAMARGLNIVGTLIKPVTVEALAEVLKQLSRSEIKSISSGKTEQIFDLEDVRHALASDHIDLFYQPKVNVSSGRVTGVECLARWQHPQYGYVSPNNFIAVVEQSELIHDFTHHVLRKAARQLDVWLQNGLDLKVSINVSMENLDRFDLPEIYAKTVTDCNVPIDRVTLEITESPLGKGLTHALDILTRIRLKGFGLSIDDFGTGYSSMKTLKYMPFTELKVDRAFAHGAAEDPVARTILESNIRLGKSLGLNVVVEGIEIEADYRLAVDFGCNEAQGYYVAKPMPSDKFEQWLLDYRNNGAHKK